MRPNESGITRASMSHTIGSLNDLRIFVARSSTDSITCDTIRKRSKACSTPFFELDVELFMRGYIATQWCDIDFGKKTLNIRKSIWQQHLGPVKTEES